MVERLDNLLKKPPQPVPALLGEGAIPVQGRILIGGHTKIGKSVLAMNLIYHLAAGTDFCGLKSHGPASVLYIDQEVGIEAFVERFLKIHTQLQSSAAVGNILVESMNFDLSLGRRSAVAEWEKILDVHKPRVLVLDPLAQFHSLNENDAGQMGLVTQHLNALVAKYGCAVILIHHFGKPSEFRGGTNRFRGSSSLTAWADTLIEVETQGGWGKLRVNWTVRRGRPIAAYRVQIDPQTLIATLVV